MLNKSSLHLAALELAAKNIPVFPCYPKKKEPAGNVVFNGHKDRTTNVDLINQWWGANPDCNIGVVPGDLGLAAIDLDGLNGFVTWTFEFEDRCTATRTHRTASGGRHLFYIGTIPQSNRKLGPGIDTRGDRGYVLWPPSIVEYPDGTVGTYTVEDDREPAPLPECISEALANVKVERKASVTGDDLDTPYNISLAVDYLTHRAPLAVEGDGGDETTYTVAAAVRDYGISEDCCTELLAEHWNDRCSPPWCDEELAIKIGNAYSYAQNEPGSRGVPKEQTDEWIRRAREERAKGNVNTAPAEDAVSDRKSLWTPIKPAEYAAMRDQEFWDVSKMLPNNIDGCIALLYGEWGNHKTNVVLTMMMDAVAKGARVIYAAGEGAYGVGKLRIPAHCRSRGMALTELDHKLNIVPAVPLFSDLSQVHAFIAAMDEFKPNIVVLDTLATAIAGEDENGSRAAAFLTSNGPAGAIRDAYKALVIMPAHAGKDKTRGVRGNSGLEGNADVSLFVEADKEAAVIKLTCKKMRDGEDGQVAFFKYEKDGVPVPVRITKEDYEARRDKAAPVDEDAGIRVSVKAALTNAGADRFMAGLSDKVLAERLCGDEPTPDSEPWRQWLSAVAAQRKALRNARNRDKAWTRGLCSEEVSHEGGKLEWRWWYPGQQSEQ